MEPATFYVRSTSSPVRFSERLRGMEGSSVRARLASLKRTVLKPLREPTFLLPRALELRAAQRELWCPLDTSADGHHKAADCGGRRTSIDSGWRASRCSGVTRPSAVRPPCHRRHVDSAIVAKLTGAWPHLADSLSGQGANYAEEKAADAHAVRRPVRAIPLDRMSAAQ